MFILLFHCFLWGMGGVLILILVCQVFLLHLREGRGYYLYIFFLLKGGGLSFNLLCQVIHCLLTKLKCKRKRKTKKNTRLFSPISVFSANISFLSIMWCKISKLFIVIFYEMPTEINFR